LEKLYKIYAENGRHVSIDSRNITKGAIFFALKGENSNGNLYAADALKKGASAVVVDDPSLSNLPHHFLVTDSLVALQQLANHHRRQLNIPVIGITGSNGKTTTKKLIYTVLSSFFKTYATQGNLNNHIGVPLSVLSIPPDAELAVIEMGANHQGEIAQLCQIAEPTHGLITNIGKAHLEGFGGIEGVKKGKGELYDYLARHKGIAFCNINQPFLEELAVHVDQIIKYSISEFLLPEYPFGKINLTSIHPSITFTIDDISFYVNLFGQHNFSNIITSVALGHHFGVPLIKMKEALARFAPESNRSEIVNIGSNQFLMDAYNANPSSMKASVDAFIQIESDLPKILILADMLELGEYAEMEHFNMCGSLAQLNHSKVILVGPNFEKSANEFGILHFMNVHELKGWWKNNKIEQHFILLKGSRGMALEKMLSD
jgi:UDP-N-acetylmuramoyl-tripeptide--D-alanyl-D-alanine ligase